VVNIVSVTGRIATLKNLHGVARHEERSQQSQNIGNLAPMALAYPGNIRWDFRFFCEVFLGVYFERSSAEECVDATEDIPLRQCHLWLGLSYALRSTWNSFEAM